MIYYHGSSIGGLEYLAPNKTWFRSKDVAQLYLTSNKAHASLYAAKCHMYPYGFDKETGLLEFHEPYEGCLKEFYGGKSGYLYAVEESDSITPLDGIKYACYTKESVRVKSVEFIEDVYKKLLGYEEKGEIIIVKFKDIPDRIRDRYHKWSTEVLALDEVFFSTEEYPMFLKTRFPDAWKEVCNNREDKT